MSPGPSTSAGGGASVGVGLEPCVDQTLLAALPDFGDEEHDQLKPASSGGVSHERQAMPAVSDGPQAIKTWVRSRRGWNVMRAEDRRAWWMKGVYEHRMEAGGRIESNRAGYEDTVKTCFGSTDFPSKVPRLPSVVDPSHTNSYCLNKNGKISVGRILTCFAYDNPHVTYCPILYPLASVFRHYLTEADSYGLLYCLVKNRRPSYVSQGRPQEEVDWRVLMQLNQKYNKKIMGHLISESSQEDVENVVKSWIWFIFDYLPLPHIVRIIDTFLLEGQKILFRVHLSLLRSFSKSVRTSHEWSGSIKQLGLKDAFGKFCKELPTSPNALLERGFRFRGLSRASIQQLSVTIEVDLKAKGISATLNDLDSEAKDRHVRLPSPKAVENVKEADGKLTFLQDDSMVYLIQNLKSGFLTQEGLRTIWHWLPQRMTMHEPILGYSSNEHGISLKTFYAKADLYEPTILVVNTTEGEIFGAYCSTHWGERKNTRAYFGTGETFLFKLDGPDGDGIKYAWVGGHDNADDDVNDADDADDAKPTLTKAEQHARDLFMSAQHDMIAIGGGGGNGLYIDSSLTFGRSEKCATFDNDPLCSSDNGNFKITTLELYGICRIPE